MVGESILGHRQSLVVHVTSEDYRCIGRPICFCDAIIFKREECMTTSRIFELWKNCSIWWSQPLSQKQTIYFIAVILQCSPLQVLTYYGSHRMGSFTSMAVECLTNGQMQNIEQNCEPRTSNFREARG